MIKKYLVYSLLTLLSITAQAQIITIPDANFKAKLLEANTTNTIAFSEVSPNYPMTIDANADGEIQVSEAALVKALNVNNSSISSLEGIQFFTGLLQLQCNNNNISSIDITPLTMLNGLNCSNNVLTVLQLNQSNNQLKSLNCSYNSLTDLNVNNASALVNLNCSNNVLTALHTELVNNSISYFDCSYNNLTSLALPNFFQFLDMGDQSIVCNVSHNQLSSLNFINEPEQLTELNLSYNNFTTFTFPRLEVLFGGNVKLSNNPLTYLDLNTLRMVMDAGPSYGGLHIENTNLTQLTIPNIGQKHVIIKNNPNLVNVNFKNGINDFWVEVYEDSSGNPIYYYYGIEMTDNPQLAIVCCDAGEVNYISGIVPGVAVTPYCTLTPGGNYNTITGNVSYNCPNSGAIASNVKVIVNNGVIAGFTDLVANHYIAYTGLGTQTVSLQLEHPEYFIVSPTNQAFNFTSYNNNPTADFCIAPNGIHPDLEVSILPLNAARPGFDAQYKVVYKNNGNQIQDGTVVFGFNDAHLDFVSAQPIASAQTTSSLSWNFTNLVPFETREIVIMLNVNSPLESPPVNIGDYLNYVVAVSNPNTDDTPADNTMSYNQTVVGSFDPNDKTVIEGSTISIDKVGEYLHYVVRFQNTGSVAAENVVVKDMLDANLDWSSLEMIASSHPYRSTLTSGNKLEVFYEGINLPAPASDEEGSHGYIAFKIKPKSTIAINDVMANTAQIYFDFNFPITTNTVTTTVSALGTPAFNQGRLFTVYPNPTDSVLTITVTNEAPVRSITIYNLLGQKVLVAENAATINVSALSPGTYFVTVATDTASDSLRFIKQ